MGISSLVRVGLPRRQLCMSWLLGGHEGIDLSQLSRYLGSEHPAGRSQHGQAHGGGNECGPKAAVALEISPWETGLASAYCWISRRGETRESHMESSAFSFPVRGQNGEGVWARGWGGARAWRGVFDFWGTLAPNRRPLLLRTA